MKPQHLFLEGESIEKSPRDRQVVRSTFLDVDEAGPQNWIELVRLEPARNRAFSSNLFVDVGFSQQIGE